MKQESFIKPMREACLKGDVDMVRLFVRRGCPVDINLLEYGQPLHLAASAQQPALCQALLDMGADANARNFMGCTPLSFAMKKDKRETFDVLLAAGADVHVRDRNGASLLHSAAAANAVGPAQDLVQRGVRWDVQDNEGRSVLHAAAVAGADDFCRFAIGLGLPMMAVDGRGMMPLHLAARNAFTSTCELFVHHGVPVDQHNAHGETALVTTAKLLRRNALRKLLDLGANPDSKDRHGYDALELCLLTKHEIKKKVEYCLILIAGGASTKKAMCFHKNMAPELNAAFRRPLQDCASRGMVRECLALMERGWDPDKNYKGRQNAFDAAIANDHDAVVEAMRAALARRAATAALQSLDLSGP